MVDRLIAYYRAQFYDWTFDDIKRAVSQHKWVWISFVVVAIGVTALMVATFAFKKYTLSFVAFAVIFISVVCLDRYSVKQHRKALIVRKEHLDDMIEFLKTAVPDVNLYHPEQIAELVARLTVRIEEESPFRSLLSKLKVFAGSIVIPIITYIAGAFSGQLQTMDIETVVIYGLAVIVTIATICLTVYALLDFLRPIFCRDYDAAISLREDLMDLQFLYLNKSSIDDESERCT